jgi:hypothetical protein
MCYIGKEVVEKQIEEMLKEQKKIRNQKILYVAMFLIGFILVMCSCKKECNNDCSSQQYDVDYQKGVVELNKQTYDDDPSNQNLFNYDKSNEVLREKETLLENCKYCK